MRVLNLQVRNVQGIKDIDWNLGEHTLFIVGGRNGSGKTSAIKSLLMAIAGKSGLKDYPEVPLREGEDDGFIDVKIGETETEYTIRVNFHRRRNGSIQETLILRDKNGNPATSPRQLLQKLYGASGLDPTAFNRLSSKDQLETLQQLYPELDFRKIDNEIRGVYDERTAVGREGKQAAARYESMPHYPDTPSERVSVSALMAELKRCEDANDSNRYAGRQATIAKRDAADAERNSENAANRVDELELQLAEAKTESKRAAAAATTKHKEANRLAEAVTKLTDEDTDEIRSQIETAEETNAKVRANAERKTAGKTADRLRAEYQSLTDSMAEAEAKKKAALKLAKLPVDGLGIDSEGLTYDGRPYEQSPNSLRFLVGAKIAMALNPELRLLVCEHGDGIDWHTFADFDAVLKSNNFQAVIEVCSKSNLDDEQCQVVMVDGADKEAVK